MASIWSGEHCSPTATPASNARRSKWRFLAVAAALGAVPAHAETVRVTIDDLVFSPAAVEAKVGDTIEWRNADILDHTATVEGDWDVVIAVGATGSLAVSKVGEVEYYCRFHPNMKGRIRVAPR
jgi:plastocyanin